MLLLEWDVAVAKEQLLAFAARARVEPHRVLVAPYALYGYGAMGLPEPLWAHRHWDGGDGWSVSVASATPLRTGDPACQLFGLGMIYLPRALVRRFLEEGWAAHFGDVEFSTWHYRRVRHDVPVDWQCRPVHVNYQASGLTL